MPADVHPQLNAALSGRYTIEKQLGAGGMATVYLAHDLRHDRKVALKLLNADLGAVVGAERFLSEIRVTANLHHPNLLPLFDSGSVDGLLFYVMPLVEGESLRQRLDRERQLPIDEALRIATAIAGALDYAHQHGVIHRDLKPENILLQHGQPVVADFGIALAVSNAGGERVTQTGLSLGTPQYMSPEQATGDRTIDARTDVYSLAAVTYEMLTGEAPHSGTTAQAIIAKLMTEEPRPVSVLRRAVPQHVDDAVLAALEKLPADRPATAGQFAAALNGTLPTQSPTRAHRRGPTPTRSRFQTAALLGTSLLALAFAALWASRLSDTPRLMQFVLDVPAEQQVVTINESAVVLSPDGMTIAYVARTEADGQNEIYLRRLDSLRAQRGPMPGMAPLFSSDGRWLYYKAPTSISRIPVNGGAAEVVVSLSGWQGYGLSSKGEVTFAADGSIYRVGDGGVKIRLVSPDSAKGESSLADPNYLDEETIAFWIQRAEGMVGNGIGITTRDGGEHTTLNLPGTRPIGMLDGHLILGTEAGSILAYPLNVRQRRVTGPPVVLLDSVAWIITGGAQLNVARNDGSLVYLRGRMQSQLALVDKRGLAIAASPEGAFRFAALSPDGRRVAAAISRNTTGGANIITQDIWTWDIDGKALARFSVDGGMRPLWSPDGRRIAFLHPTARFDADLHWAPADGSGAAEMLLKQPAGRFIVDYNFANAGRTLVLTLRDSSNKRDIFMVDLTSADRTPKPIIATRFNESEPSVSRDGRWLAYLSDETGRYEVYVRPMNSTAGRQRLTTQGGNNPEWLAGSRLVFADGGRRLVTEIREAGGALTATVRDSLHWLGSRQAVDDRGERVLVTRESGAWRIVVVKNWVQDARRKLRAR